MKIALICPTNIELMPYLRYYTDELDRNNVDYDLIVWNRNGYDYTNIDNISEYSETMDNRIRKIYKLSYYYRYTKYTKTVIEKNKYDKIIIFTIQMAMYLKRYLLKNYRGKYVIDIRDHAWNFNMKKLIKKSFAVVVSSPAFKKWLPKNINYIVSHNISKYDIEKYDLNKDTIKSNKIKVSTIGALRDFEFNSQVISHLANKNSISLEFVGTGISEEELKVYSETNNVNNIRFTGLYKKEDECEYYINSSIINAYYTGKYKVNREAIPNRLYNACIHNKPIIVSDGIYLGELVKQYNLGIVVNLDKENLYEKIINYLNSDEYKKLSIGIENFLKQVSDDEDIFIFELEKFIKY